MTRYIVIALFATLLLTSCSPSATKKAAEIEMLEKELKESSQNGKSDTSKVKQLLGDYMFYAKTFTTDSLTPVYLMKSALFFQHVRLLDSAIYCYNTVYTKFPQYPKAGMALFSEAFIYGNEKHDLIKAKAMYEEFLAKYPNSTMAPSAQMELQSLGKTPEQIMAEIDSMKAVREAATATQR